MAQSMFSDTDTLPVLHDLRPGTRVQVQGAPIRVTFRTPIGFIVRSDRWEGSYIIRMERPAIYHNDDGTTEDLPEIRESFDNLLVLATYR